MSGCQRTHSRRSFKRARGPVKNRITHQVARIWEITVATAAPRTPMFSPKIRRGSSTTFTAAPAAMVIIPVRPKPWQLIKPFMPRLSMAKKVPQM